jgi:hypothetical protein
MSSRTRWPACAKRFKRPAPRCAAFRPIRPISIRSSFSSPSSRRSCAKPRARNRSALDADRKPVGREPDRPSVVLGNWLLYQRVPKLFADLALARGDGRYAPSSAASTALSSVLDDWGQGTGIASDPFGLHQGITSRTAGLTSMRALAALRGGRFRSEPCAPAAPPYLDCGDPGAGSSWGPEFKSAGKPLAKP